MKIPNPIYGHDPYARARRREFLVSAGWWIVFGTLGFLAFHLAGAW